MSSSGNGRRPSASGRRIVADRRGAAVVQPVRKSPPKPRKTRRARPRPNGLRGWIGAFFGLIWRIIWGLLWRGPVVVMLILGLATSYFYA